MFDILVDIYFEFHRTAKVLILWLEHKNFDRMKRDVCLYTFGFRGNCADDAFENCPLYFHFEKVNSRKLLSFLVF